MLPGTVCTCCSGLAVVSRTLLEERPWLLSATKEALTASTMTTMKAGSGTPAATVGAEIEEGHDAELPETSEGKSCRRESDGEISPSKLAAKLLLV